MGEWAGFIGKRLHGPLRRDPTLQPVHQNPPIELDLSPTLHRLSNVGQETAYATVDEVDRCAHWSNGSDVARSRNCSEHRSEPACGNIRWTADQRGTVGADADCGSSAAR